MAASVLATALVLTPGVASAANQSAILSPGQEAGLDSSSVPLSPLTDGRLAGAGMEVQVEGVAFTDEVSDSTQTVSAASGAQLVVVETNTTWQVGDSASTTTDTTGLTIASGSNSAQLQLSQVDFPNSGDQYFAVAIPAGGPAVLTLSVAGLTQTLDLRTDTRPATAPKILYRSQTSPFVTVSPNSVTDFTASSSLGPVTGQFGIARAYLSAWQPFTQTYVSDPATAYLDVEFSPTNMAVSGANGGPATPTGVLETGRSSSTSLTAGPSRRSTRWPPGAATTSSPATSTPSSPPTWPRSKSSWRPPCPPRWRARPASSSKPPPSPCRRR